MIKVMKSRMALIATMALLLLLLPCTIAFAADNPSLSKKSIIIAVDKTYELNVKNAAKGSSSIWASGNPKIATVNKNGLVTGVAVGTAEITCKVKTAKKSYNLSATVTVILGAETVSIKNKADQMKVGDTIDLDYILTPEASNDIVTWETDNDNAASIDSDGKLTAKQVGEVQITAITLSGVKEVFPVKIEDADTVVVTSKDVDESNNLCFPDRTFDNVYVSNSITNANVIFDRCTINGTLTIEAGSDYGVEVASTKAAAIRLVSPGNLKKSTRDMKQTGLYIRNDTVVNNISLEANCYFDAVEAENGIGSLTIAPQIDGECEMKFLGYKGDLFIDYNKNAPTRVELCSCTINTANVKNAAGSYFDLTSNDDQPSTVDTINQKAAVSAAYDVETNLINIDASLKEADLIIASPIKKIVHYGSTIKFRVAEDAYVEEVVDNKNSEGKYGKYVFTNWDYGEFAFNLTFGTQSLEDVRLKDFDKVFKQWTDLSKPFVIPDQKNISFTRTGKGTYLFNNNGSKLSFGINFDKGELTISNGAQITISKIAIAKKQEN